MADIELRTLADVPADVELGQQLVREYVVATAAEQGGDVETILPYIPDYHDFAGRFLRAGGAFVVATVDGEVAGGVGVTRIDDDTCEMNRLWVREPYRRLGLGRTLALASMDEGRRLGFRRMILDVLALRTKAIALYESLGFTEIEPVHTYDFDFEMRSFGRDLPATGR